MYSVVIPVYNHASYLVEAINSALRSSLVTEILLVDDGSRDDSAQIIAQFAAKNPGRVLDFTDAKSGNTDAPARYNQLIPQCRNQWVAILNSDDSFTPGRFEALALRMAGSAANFIYGNVLITNQAGDVIGQKRSILDPEFPISIQSQPAGGLSAVAPLHLLASQNVIATTSNMIFTRDLFTKIGGIRPYRYCHDWDFALRACLCGVPQYVNQHTVNYRIHASNTISESQSAVKQEVRRMFACLQQEFPVQFESAQMQLWLSTNRYLAD